MRILVVEDDFLLRTVLSKVLEAAGHTVTIRDCGLRALRTLQERAFDLVVTDLHIPNMDGLELIEAMGNLRPPIPVVLMTGADFLEPWLQQFPILHKPFSTRQLLAVVNQLGPKQQSQEIPEGRLQD